MRAGGRRLGDGTGGCTYMTDVRLAAVAGLWQAHLRTPSPAGCAGSISRASTWCCWTLTSRAASVLGWTGTAAWTIGDAECLRCAGIDSVGYYRGSTAMTLSTTGVFRTWPCSFWTRQEDQRLASNRWCERQSVVPANSAGASEHRTRGAWSGPTPAISHSEPPPVVCAVRREYSTTPERAILASGSAADRASCEVSPVMFAHAQGLR
jgi:hypothetical protein